MSNDTRFTHVAIGIGLLMLAVGDEEFHDVPIEVQSEDEDDSDEEDDDEDNGDEEEDNDEQRRS